MTASRNARRAMVRLSVKKAAARPADLALVPESEWPSNLPGDRRLAVWMSRDYLVQVFGGAAGSVRLSINRTAMGIDGRWLDGITWDELQRIKCAIGYADTWAVECYPPADQVVNVANIRHLWLVLEPPAFAWQRGHGMNAASRTGDGREEG